MPKKFILNCKELGEALGLSLGEKKFTGYTEGEVLMKTIQHIMWEHKVEKVTPEMKEKIRSVIKNRGQA